MAGQGRKRNRISDSLLRKASPSKKRSFNPLSLLDSAAKFVAASFPYQYVEERLHNNVPEPVLKRITFFAFPKDEKTILRYSSTNLFTLAGEASKQPFQAGIKILEQDGVSDVVQIGFHLSGVVREITGICHQRKTCPYNVSVTFDRGCITSASCACSSRSILWCAHVVALTLYRIRHADHVPIKVPISDAIFVLKKSQLQKLVLHLVAKNQTSVLPYVQQLVDQLIQAQSEINSIQGVPDPTAGACADADTTWFIDMDIICQDVKQGLLAGNTGRSISRLLSKVREMVCAKDPNFVNLAIAITDALLTEFSENPNHHHNSRARKQCDSIASLWLSIISNPAKTPEEKVIFRRHLDRWSRMRHCPKENADDPTSSRTMFSIVEEACDSEHALANTNLSIQAGLVDWLCMCGRKTEAVEISLRLHAGLKSQISSRSGIYSTHLSRGGIFSNMSEPIHTIYNTLVETGYELEGLEVALIGISELFSLPLGLYAQERTLHRVEQLLAQFEDLKIEKKSYLRALVTDFSRLFFDKWSSEANLGRILLPPHSFVRFLFQMIHSEDSEFAFKLALFSLPLNLPVTDKDENSDDIADDVDVLYIDGVECLTRNQLESHQTELASVLLRACAESRTFLQITVDRILEHISRPEHLLRLSRLCHALTSSQGIVFSRSLLEVAFELSVKAIRLIRKPLERHECIRWLVTCAADTGKHGLEYIIRNWNDLFLPCEVSGEIARLISSQPLACRLKLSAAESAELRAKIRDMVIEASIRDPASCIMFALALCEDHVESFELVCHIVTQSSNRLYAAQLFNIARYLEAKKLPERALKTGVTALKQLDIGLSDDKHPAVADVLWVCTLAANLGKDELTQLVPIVVNCIRNPMLLSEIARRCCSPTFNTGKTIFSCNKEPLSRLVAAAHQLFVHDIERRLRSITPKSYAEFTSHLQKIRLAFALSEDGSEQFNILLDYILKSQKGKRKLQRIVQCTIFEESLNSYVHP